MFEVLILPRHEAREAGWKRYYSGIPCCYGHITVRSVSNGNCFECVKILRGKRKSKEKAYKRSPHVVQRRKELYQQSKDKHREKGKIYRQTDRYKELTKARRKTTKYKEIKNKWGRENRNFALEKRNSLLYQKRLRKALPKWASKDLKTAIENVYKERDMLNQNNPGNFYEVDHIVPLKGVNVCGLHVPWNLQILPRAVNRAKQNMFSEEY